MRILPYTKKKKLVNSFMLHGSIESSEKIFQKTFKIIQKKTIKSSALLVKVALKNANMSIAHATIKKRKSKISMPFFIKKRKRFSYLIKLISSVSKSTGSILKGLSKELLNLASNKGNLVEKIKLINQQSSANKTFSHFRWF